MTWSLPSPSFLELLFLNLLTILVMVPLATMVTPILEHPLDLIARQVLPMHLVPAFRMITDRLHRRTTVPELDLLLSPVLLEFPMTSVRSLGRTLRPAILVRDEADIVK